MIRLTALLLFSTAAWAQGKFTIGGKTFPLTHVYAQRTAFLPDMRKDADTLYVLAVDRAVAESVRADAWELFRLSQSGDLHGIEFRFTANLVTWTLVTDRVGKNNTVSQGLSPDPFRLATAQRRVKGRLWTDTPQSASMAGTNEKILYTFDLTVDAPIRQAVATTQPASPPVELVPAPETTNPAVGGNPAVRSQASPARNKLGEVELLALWAAGWAPDALAALAEREGVTLPAPSYLEHLREAGANPAFLKRMSLLPKAKAAKAPGAEEILSLLAAGGALAQRVQIQQARLKYREALALDPQNPALHLAADRFEADAGTGRARLTSERPVTVVIQASGQIAIVTELVELERLQTRFEEIFKTRADRTLRISVDPARPYAEAARVIAAALNAGLDRVRLYQPAEGPL